MPTPLSAKELQTIRAALRERPRVLLLGQNYRLTGDGIDPLLASLSSVHAAKNVSDFMLDELQRPEDRIAALVDAERVLPVEEELNLCLTQDWSAVITSAFEALPRTLLSIPSRRFVQQLTTSAVPETRGDTLPLYRLFGTVDRTTELELPPLSSSALRRRRTSAVEILQLLPTLASVHGHVFVEGWNPQAGSDWLRPRDLSTAFSSLGVGQVLIFGVDEPSARAIKDDDDLGELVELGTIQLFEPRLTEVISTIVKSGDSVTGDDWTTSASDIIPYQVLIDKPRTRQDAHPQDERTVNIPLHEWRRLSRTFNILRDKDSRKPLPSGLDEQKSLFRNLCGHGPEPDMWPWLDELAVRRQVLEIAIQKALDICHSPTPQDHVVVLYGQSGAGKSVVIHLLALALRRLGLPVLLAARSLVPIDQTHVDDFCALLAQYDAIAQPVFLIYDATQTDIEYLELASFLSSRNRKCVVIGTAFPGHLSNPNQRRQKRHGTAAVHPIEVSVHLSQNETEIALAHMHRFTGLDVNALRRFLGEDVSHFFAMLYRLLPDSRERLRKGLVEEVLHGSARIAQRIEEAQRTEPTVSMTQMEQRLRAALGLVLDELAESLAVVNPQDSLARRLIDAVMIVSRPGLQLPQSIALRLIDTNVTAYRSSMREDIIVEHEYEQGSYSLSARHPIEAEIWVGERIRDRNRQFAIMRETSLAIRHSEAVTETPELEFVVKLLQSIGPEGPEKFRLSDKFEEIAGIVTELRGRHDVHPRLLLVEAHTIRESIKAQQRSPGKLSRLEISKRLDNWLSSLERADDALVRALDIVQQGAEMRPSLAARRMLSTLATERAAVNGFRLGCVVRLATGSERSSIASERGARRWLSAARVSWREALRYDDDNYRALNTGCWAIYERLELGDADLVEEAELLAEWGELVDRYLDIEVPPSQLDQQDKAEQQYAARCGNVNRFQAVMARASERGSYALHVVNAREMRRRGNSRSARNYLENHCKDVLLIERSVLLLYVRVWWETETKLESYLGERVCLAFSPAQWEMLERLTAARLRLEGEEDNPVVHFLRASALLHLRRIEESVRVFDHLARLGLGGFRRSRSLMLLASAEGKPKLLSAEFQGRRQGAVHLAWCDELRTNIRFRPLEHGIADLRSGTTLRPFLLSLSFRGLFAEPPRRLRETHG